MKKRLLITSIVMMLVVAVVLSTATYAWFTSNTSVSASVMTLKAQTSEASSLGIGWTGDKAGTSITSNIYATLYPMAPKDLTTGENPTVRPLENGTTTYEIGNDHLEFFNSTIKQEGSIYKFNNNGTEEQPVVYTKDSTKATADDNSVRTFYVKNLSKANEIKSIKVSAVFPGSVSGDSNNAKYALTKDTIPTQGKKYYTRSGETFTVVSESALATGFNAGTTYYEDASAFIKSQDTTVNPDSKYYEFTKATLTIGDSLAVGTYYVVYNGMYILSGDTTAKSGIEYYTVAVSEPNDYLLNDKKADGTDYGSEETHRVFYEKLSGDDMIRVALFTKRYSVANGAKDGDASYYKYDANSGYMTDATSEVSSISTFDGTEGYFVAEAYHTLLGVLGKKETTFTAVTDATPDLNEVYYIANYDALTNGTDINATNFERWIANEIFTLDNETYTQVTSGSYDSSKTYYVANFTQQAPLTSFAANTTYYTAESTVANGEIKIDKNVNQLYYYTHVDTSITFADHLLPGEQVEIIAVVWLDGTALNDTRSGELAQVSLVFEANQKD